MQCSDIIVHCVTLFRYQKCISKTVVFISTQGTAGAMVQHYERNPFIAWAAAVSAFCAAGFNVVSRLDQSHHLLIYCLSESFMELWCFCWWCFLWCAIL